MSAVITPRGHYDDWEEGMSAEGDVHQGRVRWVFVWASSVMGAGIAVAGWYLGHVVGLGATIESLGLSVGTAVGLAGLLVAYERHMTARIDTLSARLESARVGADLRPRSEVVANYLEPVESQIKSRRSVSAVITQESAEVDLWEFLNFARDDPNDPTAPFADWWQFPEPGSAIEDCFRVKRRSCSN